MEKEDSILKLYEIGFHLVPTLSEEEANSKFSQITSKIEKMGGAIKLAKNPEQKPLAYSIKKAGGGKKDSYDSAYFGSVIFEMESSEVGAFHKWLNEVKEVIRTLLIEVPKEILVPKERRIPQSHKEEAKKTSAPSGDEKPVNEAELDKTIEQLVIE